MTTTPAEAVEAAYDIIRHAITSGPIGADALAQILGTMQTLRTTVERAAESESDQAFGRGFREGYSSGRLCGAAERDAQAQAEINARDLQIAELRLQLAGIAVDLRDSESEPATPYRLH